MSRNAVLKPIVFVACLASAVQLAVEFFRSSLGPDPVAALQHQTGMTTLVLLFVTLAITPLRRITGLLWLVQYRRMLGLFAFFYGTLHMLTYLVLDQSFNLVAMAADVTKRPFIFAGTFSFLLMVPLALTSTQRAIRRMGKRWQKLHQLIYLSAVAGVVHFYWVVKLDHTPPLIFAWILAVLLVYRVAYRLWERRRRMSHAPTTASAD